MRANGRPCFKVRLAALLVLAAAASTDALLEACSDESFAGAGPGADASLDGAANDSASDAAADVVVPFDGGACNLALPFGKLTPITELNTMSAQEQTARLTHDELNIYFQQEPVVDGGISIIADGGGPFFRLMTSSRPNVGAAWGMAIPVPGVSNPSASQTDPSVSPDNNTLYFAANQAGTVGATDLWLTTRTTPATNFTTPGTVTSLDTIDDESEPYVMPNGNALYFRSKADGGSFELAHATRSTTTAFALDTSGIFASINTTALESLPTVTFDELTLYFATDRAGAGGRQIWKATRATTSDPFGPPAPVGELNTSPFDEPSWISDDGCRIYVTSTQDGTADLFVASKPSE